MHLHTLELYSFLKFMSTYFYLLFTILPLIGNNFLFFCWKLELTTGVDLENLQPVRKAL